MKKIIYLGLLSSTFLGFSAQACINSYAFELGHQHEISDIDAEEALKTIHPQKIFKQSYQKINDYGVYLIYNRQYQKAIQVFEKIEKMHPNLAKTAANLGTAYELNGQPEKAKIWIEKGIRLDPQLHEGSEWIHVKILDAQIQQKKNSKWIQQHDVLGLDFGTQARPIATVKKVHYLQKQYGLNTVLEHSKIQMNQRLRFVSKDPITAQIIFNMANIEVYQLNNEEWVNETLYDRAGDLGYSNPQLLAQRRDYTQNSMWFLWKSSMMDVFRGVSELLSFLFYEPKLEDK